jgi:hypothetical protein
VPAAEAERMVGRGARIRARNGHVREIEIMTGPGNPLGPPSSPSLTQYMGQRYTRMQSLETGARCLGFRWIHPDDRALFMLSVTDCMAKAQGD